MSLFLLFLALWPPVQWPPPAPLDQGSLPACVGYALVGWAATGPGAVPLWRLPAPAWVYVTAQRQDGLPGPHAGTFVRAGWAALSQAGWVLPGSARYTRDRVTGAAWLHRGPVVIEGAWYWSMNAPDGQGVVRVDPAIGVEFRHAWLCYGLRADGGFLCQNSWGRWGRQGRFVIPPAALDTILATDGEISQAGRAVPGRD